MDVLPEVKRDWLIPRPGLSKPGYFLASERGSSHG